MRSTLTAALLAVGLGAGTLEAQGSYLQSNRLGYTGTFAKYLTLSNAQNAVGSVGSGVVAQRDLHMYMVTGNSVFANIGNMGPPYGPSAFQFFTFWEDLNHVSTPSNVTNSFVQIDDQEAGSVTSSGGYWNAALTQFTYNTKGGPTAPNCFLLVDDCPRFNTATASEGNFFTYDFSLVASGLTGTVWNAATGVYESVSEPTSVSGYFRAIFQNTSLADPASNGFYTVDLALNLTSGTFGVPPYNNGLSTFGSAIVPEPSTNALVAVGLAVFGLTYSRRRRRSVA